MVRLLLVVHSWWSLGEREGFGVACDWVGTRANGVQTGGRGEGVENELENPLKIITVHFKKSILLLFQLITFKINIYSCVSLYPLYF